MMNRSRRSRRGAALIEMALLVPLLFVIGYGGFEIARLFQSYEALSTVSREGARLGIKDCAASGSPSTCLQNVLATTQSFADQALPGTSIILSMYQYDSLSGLVTRVAMVPATPTPPTRFTNAGMQFETIGTAGEQHTLTTVRTRMVVSEVFYNQASVSPAFFIPFFAPGPVYEVTIF